MSLNTVSRALYRAARVTRDVRAVERGPKAVVRRQVRRTVYRHTNRTVARILRSLGL